MQPHNHKIIKPCAACKYQRRQCAPDCLFAPYFPHDHPEMFENAHRLYGVANIQRLVKDFKPLARDEAMRSIVMLSNMRAVDKVYGVQKFQWILMQSIHQAQAELDIVNSQLASCKAATLQAPPPKDENFQNWGSNKLDTVNSQLASCKAAQPPKDENFQNWVSKLNSQLASGKADTLQAPPKDENFQIWRSKLVDDFDAWYKMANGDDNVIVNTLGEANTVSCLKRKRASFDEECIDDVKEQFDFDYFSDDFVLSEEMPSLPNENDTLLLGGNEDRGVSTKQMHDEIASSYKSSRFNYY